MSPRRPSRGLLKRNGAADAPVVAAQRADELLEAGDLDGVAVWKSVARAVEELQRERTPALDGSDPRTPPRLLLPTAIRTPVQLSIG